MCSSKALLLQMPKIPMEHILEYLDFPSILVLRKVCHDLRNFIDDTKPASHLREISIHVYCDCITFNLNVPRLFFWFYIDYKEIVEGCLVKCKKDGKETILKNEDFVTVFCKDFDIVLRHQKTVLEKFTIRFDFLNSKTKERTLENIKKSFKSMNYPLPIKSLHMGVNNHKEILSTLPYIDTKPLEHININDPFGSYSTLNLNEIGHLEQWKQAKELTIRGFLQNLAENLKHFSKITLHLQEISTEVLISLKEMFLCSTTLTTMDVSDTCNSSSVIRQRLIELFGQPFFDNNRINNWFFRIPGANQFLRITQKYYYSIYFDRIEQSDVPENAIILN